ncbi:MAG: HDOD domain-containing protein [Methylococcaceae bacterium]|jgi:HD-like signal output (HDOD) protein
MSFLSPFFTGKKNEPQGNSAINPDNISIEVLKGLIPIRNLKTENLIAFATDLKCEVFPDKAVLFKTGEEADSVLYLLKGLINLSDENGNTYEVDAQTAKAKFPLSSGTKHTTTATAKTVVYILRVSQKIMVGKNLQNTPLSEIVIPEEYSDNRLLQAFTQHCQNEELEIPSLPDIAIKLRKAIQQDIGINEAVKMIQLDPVISARLVEVANCPLYFTNVPVKSCLNAVNRIGLNAVRNLVISFSINHIFKSNSPIIRKHLDKLWKKSLYISALSYTLASVSKQANPDEALLAGLLCDIGLIPFLNFVADLPKDYYSEEEMLQAMPFIKGPIGYKILQNWDFPAEFLDVPAHSDNWYYNASDQLSLTDIVILSRLHSQIGQTDLVDLPAITSIPAASKLLNFSLSPEHSLNLLHDAKQQINDALKAFSN